jgi:hypothetical protein
MDFSVSEIYRAIRRVDKAGLKPMKVLIDESMVKPYPYKENRDQTNEVTAQQVFGIPIELSDGFVVVPEAGCLAVWNHEPADLRRSLSEDDEVVGHIREDLQAQESPQREDASSGQGLGS